MDLQACLHSMYHRNYACNCGPEGLKLTETHLVDLKSIFDFSNITDFFRYNGFITDFCCFDRFSTFLRTKKSEMPSFLRSAPEGSLMGT